MMTRSILGLTKCNKSNTYLNQGTATLNDSLRMIKCDDLAVSIEGGNQKSGYYFRPLCDVHKCLTDDISHCYQ